MAETFKTEVSGLRADIARLTEVNQTLQLRLEAPKAEDEELLRKLNEPPRPIAVWKPEPVNNDPLEGLGMIRRTLREAGASGDDAAEGCITGSRRFEVIIGNEKKIDGAAKAV